MSAPLPQLVSVIIPVFNRAAMLQEAVQSVVAQRHRPIEVIIVDDGSSDNTLLVAEDLANELGSTELTVQVMSQANSGPGVARQAGLERASGHYIQFLDSDDLLEPDKLSLQVQGLIENPSCAVSYCIQRLVGARGELLDAAWMRSNQQHDTMFPAMLSGRLWGTPVPLYRKDLLDQVGPWTALKNEEDWEYDCRVASHGVNLHYVAQTLVTIRRHNEGHFGMRESGDQATKLEDRCYAFLAINQHAIAAGIAKNQADYLTFKRMAFHLCRQAASSGLIEPAKVLLKQVVRAKPQASLLVGLETQLYYFASNVFGWQRTAEYAERIKQWGSR